MEEPVKCRERAAVSEHGFRFFTQFASLRAVKKLHPHSPPTADTIPPAAGAASFEAQRPDKRPKQR